MAHGASSNPRPEDRREAALYDVVPGFDPQRQYSIEEGFLILTMMPSLRCDLNCPHCYLSLEQRRNSPVMAVRDIERSARKVAAFYRARGPAGAKQICCYWYGGEPTSQGLAYMEEAFDRIGAVFEAQEGFGVTHEVLTSLLNVDPSWFAFFHRRCGSRVQSSCDLAMRGRGYARKWDRRVREAVADGLKVSTLSVVNRAFEQLGAEHTLEYLTDLGVVTASFLPFMLNEQNASGAFARHASSMASYSEFMIALMEHWCAMQESGRRPPVIGQASFVLGRAHAPARANTPCQTLFLHPNGDLVLPDYRGGHMEITRVFGNILEQEFAQVLASSSRREYMRRQYLRAGNQECLRCPHSQCCLMEFWKPNRQGDACFGARPFVEWVLANRVRLERHMTPAAALAL